jgi:hypothetical protein
MMNEYFSNTKDGLCINANKYVEKVQLKTLNLPLKPYIKLQTPFCLIYL